MRGVLGASTDWKDLHTSVYIPLARSQFPLLTVRG